MRLIDADALLTKVRQIDFLKAPNSTKLSAGEIMAIINKQPTAFDTKKVVEQLESARNCHYSNKWDEEGDLVLIKSIESNIAIDIVKKGGVK